MNLFKPRSYFSFRELSSGRCFLYCLISGASTGLCVSAQQVWFLCFLTLIPFIYIMLCVKHSARRHFFCSLGFFAAYYTPVLLWLYTLTRVLSDDVSPIIAFLIMTLALILILLVLCTLSSLCLLPLKWLARPSFSGLFIFASLFILGEIIPEYMGELSFPWIRLGNAAAACTPFIQSASLFGSLFISLIILSASGFITLALYNLPRKKRGAAIYALAALTIISANLLYGALAHIPQTSSKTEVLLVQGNYSDSKKWREDLNSTYERYKTLTLNGLNAQTRIVVWPETAITTILDEQPWLKDSLKDLATQNNITIITGAFDSQLSPDGQKEIYNALYVITPDGNISEPYYKQALVPVGEFIPFEKAVALILPWLSELRALEGTYFPASFGSENMLFDTPDGKISGIICYESIIPHIAREQSAMGSELLVMITNDSWFGTSAALTQHLAHAQMRAVENGKYLLRAGNTGITAIISPSGEIISRLQTDTAGSLNGTVSMISERTLYSRIGDLILLPGLLFTLYAAACSIYEHIKFKKTQ